MMKIYTIEAYDLKSCMKEDNLGPKKYHRRYYKGDNFLFPIRQVKSEK